MRKSLVLALLALAVACAQVHSKEQGKASKKAPKECFPLLREPEGNYAPFDGAIPYSVWYYNLYEQFCHGKSEAKCMWACAKAPSKAGAATQQGD